MPHNNRTMHLIAPCLHDFAYCFLFEILRRLASQDFNQLVNWKLKDRSFWSREAGDVRCVERGKGNTVSQYKQIDSYKILMGLYIVDVCSM